MTDLVTGATGHIGNVLCRHLLERGHAVRALLRRSSSLLPLQDLPVEIAHGDVLDEASLLQAMQGIDVVYHLAAHISLTGGEDPCVNKVNLEGTRLVLRAARQAGVRRLVYASSIYALSMPAAGVVDERCPFDPHAAHGAYDRSKAAASLEVLAAAHAGLDAVIVCPTAVTGPYDFQTSDTGRGILYNLSPGLKFTVDGAYDFVDVRDVAAGMFLAAGRGLSAETYILGGERLTVCQMARLIWEAAGGWHLSVHLPDWVADLAAQVLPLFDDDPIVSPYSLAAIRSNSHISHQKAARLLGYHPRPLTVTVPDAVRWWQQRSAAATPLPDSLSTAAS